MGGTNLGKSGVARAENSISGALPQVRSTAFLAQLRLYEINNQTMMQPGIGSRARIESFMTRESYLRFLR